KFAITKEEPIDRVNPVFLTERIRRDNQIESITSAIPGPLTPGAPWHERHIPVQHVAHKRTLVANLYRPCTGDRLTMSTFPGDSSKSRLPEGSPLVSCATIPGTAITCRATGRPTPFLSKSANH